MFIGEYKNSIDPKGRIIVPAKFREGLGGKFILTKGTDTCLFVFSMQEWKNFESELQELPIPKKDARAFARYFFSSAVECEAEKQGRMNIPQNLREYAKIDKELFTIGVNTRIEIWAKSEWERYQQEELSQETIAERMSSLGI